MRIIIKPAGILILIVMIALLGGMIYLKGHSSAGIKPSESPQGVSGSATPTNILVNPGFEDSFEPHPPSKTAPGQIVGPVAKGWMDNSDWGKVKIVYQSEIDNPHGGKYCQRIDFEARKEKETGQIQFIQECPAVQGKIYHAAIWVRTNMDKQPITFTIRHSGLPYETYASHDFIVGKEWQKLEVTGKATLPDDMYMMVVCQTPGVRLWVDDGSLELVP